MTLSTAIRIAPSRAARAVNLLRTVQFTHPSSCPCHANPNYHNQTPSTIHQARRHLATPVDYSQQKEYAFEMAASSIRFGPGCTKEVGMDFKNMGSKRVMVVTDQNVRKLNAMKQVIEGLTREGVTFEIYDKVRVEPKDSSIKEAIEFAKPWKPDAFLAVGGGSVIDTAKLMNLYTTFPGKLPSSERHTEKHAEPPQTPTSSTSSTLLSAKASPSRPSSFLLSPSLQPQEPDPRQRAPPSSTSSPSARRQALHTATSSPPSA
jgi:hypothetical protein